MLVKPTWHLMHSRAIACLSTVLSSLIPRCDLNRFCYATEVAVPDWVGSIRDGSRNRAIDLGFLVDGDLVGGIEVCHTNETKIAKWAHYRAFGFDVIEVSADWVLNADWQTQASILYQCAAVSPLTFQGAYRSFMHPMFSRQPFDVRIADHPPLSHLKLWESQHSVAAQLDMDARRNSVLGDAVNYFSDFFEQQKLYLREKRQEPRNKLLLERMERMEARSKRRHAKRAAEQKEQAERRHKRLTEQQQKVKDMYGRD